MTQAFAIVDTPEATTYSADAFDLTFVEDADYEFVGGGNAVNGY